MERIADLAIALATVLSLTMLLPQLLRLRRYRVVTGVSPTWVALGVGVNLCWIAYLAWADLWVAALAQVAITGMYVLLAVVLVRLATPLAVGIRRAVAVVAVFVVVLLLGGWSAMGTALGLAYGVQLAPSVWTAWRTPDPAGVSLTTWVVAVAEGWLWGLYGLHHRDVAVVLYGAVGIVFAGAIVVRLVRTRRPSADAAGHWGRADPADGRSLGG